MQDIDYSKISITAKLVAHLRQFSDIPFAQDVAEHIKAEEAIQEIARRLNTENQSPEERKEMEAEGKVSAPLLEARYKSIVEVIHQTGIKQVLELASGFSLRGLAMAQDTGISYVESDLPDLNTEKTKLISTLREKYQLEDRGNHHVATANALARTELEAAAEPLDRDKPILIVNEGLIPYLSEAEIENLTENVRYLLGKFNGGSWITPDFTTRQTADDVSEHRKRFRDAVSDTTARQLHGAAFASEEAIDEFISDHGFSAVHSYQTDLVKDLVSVGRLGLDSKVVERLKPHMRIWLMSPVA